MVLQEVSEHSRCHPEGRALTRPPHRVQFCEGRSQQGPLSSKGVPAWCCRPTVRSGSHQVPKEESEKAGLKLNIQKMKIMASGPITSWKIDGETVETVSDFIFLGSKITADGALQP